MSYFLQSTVYDNPNAVFGGCVILSQKRDKLKEYLLLQGSRNLCLVSSKNLKKIVLRKTYNSQIFAIDAVSCEKAPDLIFLVTNNCEYECFSIIDKQILEKSRGRLDFFEKSRVLHQVFCDVYKIGGVLHGFLAVVTSNFLNKQLKTVPFRYAGTQDFCDFCMIAEKSQVFELEGAVSRVILEEKTETERFFALCHANFLRKTGFCVTLRENALWLEETAKSCNNHIFLEKPVTQAFFNEKTRCFYVFSRDSLQIVEKSQKSREFSLENQGISLIFLQDGALFCEQTSGKLFFLQETAENLEEIATVARFSTLLRLTAENSATTRVFAGSCAEESRIFELFRKNGQFSVVFSQKFAKNLGIPNDLRLFFGEDRELLVVSRKRRFPLSFLRKGAKIKEIQSQKLPEPGLELRIIEKKALVFVRFSRETRVFCSASQKFEEIHDFREILQQNRFLDAFENPENDAEICVITQKKGVFRYNCSEKRVVSQESLGADAVFCEKSAENDCFAVISCTFSAVESQAHVFLQKNTEKFALKPRQVSAFAVSAKKIVVFYWFSREFSARELGTCENCDKLLDFIENDASFCVTSAVLARNRVFLVTNRGNLHVCELFCEKPVKLLNTLAISLPNVAKIRSFCETSEKTSMFVETNCSFFVCFKEKTKKLSKKRVFFCGHALNFLNRREKRAVFLEESQLCLGLVDVSQKFVVENVKYQGKLELIRGNSLQNRDFFAILREKPSKLALISQETRQPAEIFEFPATFRVKTGAFDEKSGLFLFSAKKSSKPATFCVLCYRFEKSCTNSLQFLDKLECAETVRCVQVLRISAESPAFALLAENCVKIVGFSAKNPGKLEVVAEKREMSQKLLEIDVFAEKLLLVYGLFGRLQAFSLEKTAFSAFFLAPVREVPAVFLKKAQILGNFSSLSVFSQEKLEFPQFSKGNALLCASARGRIEVFFEVSQDFFEKLREKLLSLKKPQEISEISEISQVFPQENVVSASWLSEKLKLSRFFAQEGPAAEIIAMIGGLQEKIFATNY